MNYTLYMTNLGKKIIVGGGVIVLLILVLFIWRSMQVFQNNTLTIEMPKQEVATTTIFESIELKSQDDFKLIGETIFSGGGFEPGWNFKLNLAGNKFGVEMLTKYGEAKYVGYIDLITQSTSSKVWEGKVLDIEDTMQEVKITIQNKKCTEPSGDEVDYSIKVNVADEKLDGCAKMAI